MPNVPLRTDYLAGLGGAYGRGQGMAANIEGVRLGNAMNRANLDEYYQEVQFRKGLSSFIKSHPEMELEEAGEKYSLSVGRPKKAQEFRKSRRQRLEYARARFATFTDAISKFSAAGVLDKNQEILAKQFPEFKDFDYKAVEVKNDGWTEITTKNGDTIMSNSGMKRAFHIPKKSNKWRLVPKPVGGMVAMVNTDDPSQVFPLGKWTEPEGGAGGKGGKTSFEKIVVWEYMQRELGISKAQLKNLILSGKFKNDDQIATNILTKIASGDFGPIDWDAGLSDPKSKEGQKVGMIYKMILEALREARGEIGEESVRGQFGGGPPPGVPPGSQKGTYKGKPAWRAPDGKIYVED